MSNSLAVRVRDDRSASMNSYLRKMMGYTSQTLLEFYRYLLTPPSLEEVVENRNRERIYSQDGFGRFSGSKRKRWAKRMGSRKRRRMGRGVTSLPPPTLNGDGWTITHDEQNGIFCGTRVDHSDDEILMQSGCSEILVADDDMSINYSVDIGAEVNRADDDSNADLNSSIDQIKFLEQELNKLKASLTLLRPALPASYEEENEEGLGELRYSASGTPRLSGPIEKRPIPGPNFEAITSAPAPPPPPPALPKFATLKKPNFVTSGAKKALKPVSRGVSLVDVLQNGVPKSLLKPAPGVRRSPGGTPVKSADTPGGENFLMQALKKKFQKAHAVKSPQSPTSPFAMEKENETPGRPVTPLGSSKRLVTESEWEECSPLRSRPLSIK